MKTIRQEYRIKASIDYVWSALTDPSIITQWGGGPAVIDDKVGTVFSLWGGDITGKNIKVVPKSLLIQEWKSVGWNKPSEVTFTLREQKNTTILQLNHKDIPVNEVIDIELGWKSYYCGPLQEYAEKR